MSIKIKKAIIITAEYYGRQLSESVLEMYADDLADLDPDRVSSGYQQYRRNPANRTFPLPAQIRELVNPNEFIRPEILARETAARISAAIPRFGWTNPAEAKLFIGPEGWEAVQRQGGWEYLCEHHGLDISPSVFQAQVRDQLEGVFRYGHAAIEKALGVPPSKRGGDLIPISQALKSLTTPEEGA